MAHIISHLPESIHLLHRHVNKLTDQAHHRESRQGTPFSLLYCSRVQHARTTVDAAVQDHHHSGGASSDGLQSHCRSPAVMTTPRMTA